jgi:hypothetical protein
MYTKCSVTSDERMRLAEFRGEEARLGFKKTKFQNSVVQVKELAIQSIQKLTKSNLNITRLFSITEGIVMYNKVASSRLVYYSIFDLYGVLLTEMYY